MSPTTETRVRVVPSWPAGAGGGEVGEVGEVGDRARWAEPTDERRRRRRWGNVFVGAGSPKMWKRSGPEGLLSFPAVGLAVGLAVERRRMVVRSPSKTGMARSRRGRLTKTGADASIVVVGCAVGLLKKSSKTASERQSMV